MNYTPLTFDHFTATEFYLSFEDEVFGYFIMTEFGTYDKEHPVFWRMDAIERPRPPFQQGKARTIDHAIEAINTQRIALFNALTTLRPKQTPEIDSLTADVLNQPPTMDQYPYEGDDQTLYVRYSC